MTVLFYLFSTVLIASSAAVSFGRNPVHSVLFLILAFFNAAALFLLLGAEFLAFILIVVYAGAVAVLFLFIVMMIPITFQSLRQNTIRYLPFTGLVAAIGFGELVLAVKTSPLKTLPPSQFPISQESNIHQLGQILYTHYLLAFQIIGVSLLVAVIGATVLTLKTTTKSRSRSKPRQPVLLINAPTRQGVKIP